MNREILIWPDSMLRRTCEAVPAVDDAVRELLNDMTSTMVAAGGAGLAAPQVGFALRAVVILVKNLDPQQGKPITNESYAILKLVNPRIIERSDAMVPVNEACLSLPGVVAPTRRHKWVKAEALDENGKRIEVEGDGQLAIALQHEIDHLDGKVFIDQLSQLKRNLLSKKFTKAKRHGMRYVFEQRESQPAPN